MEYKHHLKYCRGDFAMLVFLNVKITDLALECLLLDVVFPVHVLKTWFRFQGSVSVCVCVLKGKEREVI